MSDRGAALRRMGLRKEEVQKKTACSKQAVFLYSQGQNSLRPLFAAMRMRRALSLMKPAASAWL
ncbi:hypothetical protein SRABI06_00994 [Pseudomonas brassicacearum]|nr:hypothetical protein SRABI06_00994 [Pseudomonas brassicacearum]